MLTQTYNYEGHRVEITVPDCSSLILSLRQGLISPEEVFEKVVSRALEGNCDLPKRLLKKNAFRAWVFFRVEEIAHEAAGITLH